MLQPNIPRKTSATIQVWASLALVIACLIMSFMPIIKLDTAESGETIQEFLDEIGSDHIEVPEHVNVSCPDLIKSTGLMFNVISVAADSDNTEKVNKLQEKIESEDGQKCLMIAVSIANVLTDSFDEEAPAADAEEATSSKKSVLETVISLLIVLAVVFGVFGLTIALPIYFIIAAIKALIPALKHKNDPENAIAAVTKQLGGALMFPLLLMLFQSIVPGMSYGAGTIGLLVIAILTAVLGVAMSRLTHYTPAQFKYINVLQGASLVGVVGYLVFFLNILKTNIFSSFIHGKLFDYIQYGMDKKEHAKDAMELAKQWGQDLTITYQAENGYLVSVLLFVVYVLLVVSSISYLSSAVNRLSCSAKKTNLLVPAILTLPAYIIPTFIKGAKYAYPKYAEAEHELLYKAPADTTLLNLSAEQESALSAALVGIIIMLVAEVALIVLEKILCRDTTADEKQQIAAGALVATAVADTAAPAEAAAESVEITMEEEAPVAEEAAPAAEAEENKEDKSESEVQ